MYPRAVLVEAARGLAMASPAMMATRPTEDFMLIYCLTVREEFYVNSVRCIVESDIGQRFK